jgi:acid phosphatase family membrane protein YuiD
MINTLLLASATSWIMAQLTKVIFGLMRYGKKDTGRIFWRIVWAGGMPSAHSALVSSSTLVIYLTLGGESIVFGFSLIMAAIVIYDRIRLYSIYNQFQERYPSLKNEVQKDPMLKDLVGHRVPEILVGIIIGLLSGFIIHVNA